MPRVGSRKNNRKKNKILKKRKAPSTLKKRPHGLSRTRVKSHLKPSWIQTGGDPIRDMILNMIREYLPSAPQEENDTIIYVFHIMQEYGFHNLDISNGEGFNLLIFQDFYDTYVFYTKQGVSVDEINVVLKSIKEYCASYNTDIRSWLSGNPEILTVHAPLTVNDITSLFNGLRNTLENIRFMMNIINIKQPSGKDTAYATAYAIFNFLTKNRYLADIKKDTYAIQNINPFAAAMVMYYREITKNEDNFDVVEFLNKCIYLGIISFKPDLVSHHSTYEFHIIDNDSYGEVKRKLDDMEIAWYRTPIYISFPNTQDKTPEEQFILWHTNHLRLDNPWTIWWADAHSPTEQEMILYSSGDDIAHGVSSLIRKALNDTYINFDKNPYDRFVSFAIAESWTGDNLVFGLFWQTFAKFEGDLRATIRYVNSEIQCEDTPALCMEGGMAGGRVYKYKVQSARVSNKRAGSHLNGKTRKNRKPRKPRKNKTIQTGGIISSFASSEPNVRIGILTALVQFLANGISRNDFQNDSIHDGLLQGAATESTWLIDCLSKVESSELYGQFFSLHQTTGIMQADMAKLMQHWNVVRDAGPWSSLTLSNVCSNWKFTGRNVSNLLDPAKTGSGLGYLCSDTLVKLFGIIDGTDTAKQNAAMTQFIKLCVEYVFNMQGVIDADVTDGKHQTIELVKEYLNGITCTEVGNGYIKCTFTYEGESSNEFKWEASQSVMAKCINVFGSGGADVRNQGADAGFTEAGLFPNPHIIGVFLEFLNKIGVDHDLRPRAVSLLCRVLKYMGDKSHIVAAICLILSQAFAGGKPETKPWFISTHDRMLCKAIIETIAHCEKPLEDEAIRDMMAWLLDIIATNLGCIGICWTAVANHLSGKYSIYESTKVNIPGDDVIDGYAYFKPDLSKAFWHEIEQIKQRFIKYNPELTPVQPELTPKEAFELYEDERATALPPNFADANPDIAIAWLNHWKENNVSYNDMVKHETKIEEEQRKTKMDEMLQRVFTAIINVFKNTPTRKSSRNLPDDGDIKRTRQLFCHNDLTIRHDNSTDELVEVLQFILFMFESDTVLNDEITGVLNTYIPEANGLYESIADRYFTDPAKERPNYKCTDRDVAMVIVGYTWKTETKTFTLDEVFSKINENSTQVNEKLPVGQRLVLTNLAESYVDNIITAIGLLRMIKKKLNLA